MKYADINRRFTEIVAEWLAKGYSINTASMSGSQGETAKIDLTDGKEIVRILVDRFSDYAANVEGVEIIVGKALDADVRPNNNDNWATLWNNRLEVLQQKRFFKIGESRVSGTQYGTEAEAKAAAELRVKRYIAKDRSCQDKTFTGEAIEIAKRVIRRKFGVTFSSAAVPTSMSSHRMQSGVSVSLLTAAVPSTTSLPSPAVP